MFFSFPHSRCPQSSGFPVMHVAGCVAIRMPCAGWVGVVSSSFRGESCCYSLSLAAWRAVSSMALL